MMPTREEVNSRIRRTNIRGKEYAEVCQRVAAFWELFPNGAIVTEMLTDDGERCVFKATVMDGDMPMATGHAFEVKFSSNVNKTSYVENCETSAVGRALGILGIGSDGALASAEEVQAALDAQGQSKAYKAPVAGKQPTKKQSAPQEPRECHEWAELQKALSDYHEITNEDKGEVWKKFSHGRPADVFKRDHELCKAALADIERALNE